MTVPERPTRILVVDDEEQIRRALKSILSHARLHVDLAATGEEALMKAIDAPPDLVVLDLTLPDSERPRGLPRAAQVDDGADPHPVRALRRGRQDRGAGRGRRRLPHQAVLRRRAARAHPRAAAPRSGAHVAAAGRARPATSRSTSPAAACAAAGEEIALTPTEFDILAFLARNAGRVVTQRMILEQVWGPEYVEDAQTLRVHVSNLRKKIEPRPGGPRYILTEPGVGFRFAAADAEPD